VYDLQQLMLHMDSLFTPAPGRVCLQELLYAPGMSFCCTYSCPSTRAFVLHLDVSGLQEYAHLFGPKRAYAAPVRVCPQEL
jgi:hypothetical protein